MSFDPPTPWTGETPDDPNDSSLIRLMHHDARWRQEFEQTRSGLLQSCEGRVSRIDHVGSTAVPGLIARPVIDVVASVTEVGDLDFASLNIEGLNFRVVDSPAWASTAIVLEKPRHGDATHRVFLLGPDDTCYERLVAMRDFLRANPEEALRFEATKVQRWKRGEGDPQQYDQDKAIFFSHLEDQFSGGG